MKKLLILFLLLFSLPAYSQLDSFIPEDFRLHDEYQDVVETGLSDILMYSNAKEWIAKTFGDYKAVIQFEEETTKKLIIKGRSFIDYSRYLGDGRDTYFKEDIGFTITIECRDKKFRYTISNIIIISDIDGEISENENNYHHVYFNNNYSDLNDSKEALKNLENRIDPLLNRKLNKKEKEDLYNLRLSFSQTLDYIKYTTYKCDTHVAFQKKDNEAVNSLILSLKKAMTANNNF